MFLNVIVLERKRIMSSSFARHMIAATPREFHVDLSCVVNPEGFVVTKNVTTNVTGVVAMCDFSLTTANHPYLNIRLTSGGKKIYCDVHPMKVVEVLNAIKTDITEKVLWKLCED